MAITFRQGPSGRGNVRACFIVWLAVTGRPRLMAHGSVCLPSPFEKCHIVRVIWLTARCLAYSLSPVFWYRFDTARMATLNRLSVSRATVTKARGTTLSLPP
jgi:hypothetical protein